MFIILTNFYTRTVVDLMSIKPGSMPAWVSPIQNILLRTMKPTSHHSSEIYKISRMTYGYPALEHGSSRFLLDHTK